MNVKLAKINFYCNEAHTTKTIAWIAADEAILRSNATDEAKNAAAFRLDKNINWLVTAAAYGNGVAIHFINKMNDEYHADVQ